MAHHKSAKKRIRQTIAKRMANKVKKSTVRTMIKNLRNLIEEKNKEEAQKLLVGVQAKLAKLAKTGVYHANKSSRLTSRLASQINKI